MSCFPIIYHVFRWLRFAFLSAVLFACNGDSKTSETHPEDAPQVYAVQGSGHFLNLSDIHFNAFYDPDLVEELYNAEPSAWNTIFEKSTITQADGSKDTNYPLLNSFLTSAQKRIAKPDFILISGDFIAHNYQYNYHSLISGFAQKAGIEKNQWHANFINKTLQYMAGEFQIRFPGVPVIPALGNSDAYCGDYHVQPGGSFLRELTPIWASILPDNKGTFERTFPQNGYYALDAPFNPDGIRIIVLNTILFSVKFNSDVHDFFCQPGHFGSGDEAPGKEMLAWVENEIKAMKPAQQAWLILHIPPGNDPNSCSGKGFYKQAFNRELIDIYVRNHERITASFAGHYHRDDWRVIADGGFPLEFIHIGPAITTSYGNNPGYQIVQYDPQSGALDDYSTYFTNLESPTENPTWEVEYNFRESYPGYALQAASLMELHDRIARPGEFQNEYNDYYSGSTDAKQLAPKFWAHVCAQTNLTLAGFNACMAIEGRECH